MNLVQMDIKHSDLNLARLAMNQATTRHRWTHEESLEGYARHGIRQVALWRDKVRELGTRETRATLRRLDLSVTGLNRIGPVFRENGDPDPLFLDDAKRGIDEAFEMNADNLMFFPGTSLPEQTDLDEARSRARDCLFEVLPLARQANVKLVLEPLHPMIAGDRSCINTMRQSNDLCDEAGDGLGLVVDVYHVWWDPELRAEIERAGPERLAGFHVSDWLVPTKDLLCDRGMIGDGVIELRKIRGWMEKAGYRGPVEIEIFSLHWWRQDPDDAVRLAIERTLALA